MGKLSQRRGLLANTWRQAVGGGGIAEGRMAKKGGGGKGLLGV